MSSNQNTKGEHLFLLMYKASRFVENFDNQSIRDLGFSNISDFIVLELLLHKGPLPVNVIGQKVMLTSGSATTAIDRAQKRNFVRRERDPNDGRVVNVALTDTGREFISCSFKKHADNLERLFNALTKDEKRELARLLKKVGKTAEAMGQ